MNAPNGFSHDAQRYLDGEPYENLSPDERARADRLLKGVEAYTERLAAPDARLDRSVMEAIRSAHATRRQIGWRWLVQPQAIRLRPIWVPALAALLVAVVWLGTRQPTPEPGGVAAGQVARDTIFVHFELMAPNAQLVSLAGSFNDWQPDAIPLTRRDGGLWSATIPLPVGEHEYQFVVDGTEWITDPTAHAQTDDGFGGTNSVLVVGPKGVVRS